MPKKTARQRRAVAHKQDNLPLIIGVGVIAVVGVLLLVLLNLNLDTRSSVGAIVGTGKVWGKDSAPVTIEMYSDFQ